ncbi:hypothetical protein A3J90_04935 [candidate division WOR-1 bacterium RIFOXYC2_FULL_37_10]|uniref:Uncharacterized protein n=1 Tax=candidate division WOR-1 bacterium RIFOXYB2_FULL_37_13 TaxID=1802579 RepID=A0A1F4SRU2_UNCSA|nr:MAG: hypothetical protein A2310_06070 [candidate division WOR-1 bacterium RIFOXYB2_FULL_37_13]OGC35566.1 MAG: hypothetical protein A3J90_04935 [candidate division WOR-1 bacterium RIFOXYC2_FULL_37_10]
MSGNNLQSRYVSNDEKLVRTFKDKGLLVYSRFNNNIVFLGNNGEKVELNDAHGRLLITDDGLLLETQSKTLPSSYDYDDYSYKKIVFNQDGTVVVIPYLKLDEKEGSLELYLPAPAGDQISVSLPPELPRARTSFSDQAESLLYKQRRKKMVVRVVRGDYVPDTNLELFSYLGAGAVKKLGSEQIIKLHERLEVTEIEARECYFSFLERVWEETSGQLSSAEFCRIADRWEQVFNAMDFREIRRLFRFFDSIDFYQYLHNGRDLLRSDETQKWVTYFLEEDFQVAAAVRYCEPSDYEIPPSDVPSHDLAFYAWINRKSKDWLAKDADYQARAISLFSNKKVDSAYWQKRVRGTIMGPELASNICTREIAQNSRDAGSNVLKISSYLRNRGYTIEHVVEYEDSGKGMTASDIKRALFNIEKREKFGSLRSEDKRSTGGFGIGFKSVFKDADRVVLKSSTGNGKIVEAYCRCVRVDGVFDHVEVESFREIDGNMAGTWVQTVKEIGNKYENDTMAKGFAAEHLFGKQLKRYLGLVRDMKIIHNGTSINEEILSIKSITLPDRGTYSLLEVEEGLERVSHDGLWMNGNKAAYLKYLPDSLKEYFEDSVLELGELEKPTRGRGFALEDEKKIGKIAFILAARKAIKQHLSDRKEFQGFPYNYFSSRTQNADYVEKPIRDDAIAINKGEFFNVDFSKYFGEGENKLAKLLTLVEVVGDDGIKISLRTLRDSVTAAHSSESKELPDIFNSCLVSEKMKERGRAGIADRKTYVKEYDDWKVITEPSADEQRFLAMVNQTLADAGAGDISPHIFKSKNRSANAYGGNGVIWYNQEPLTPRLVTMPPALSGLSLENKSYAWFSWLVSLTGHETAHSWEGRSNFTHGTNPKIDGSFAAWVDRFNKNLAIAGFNPFGTKYDRIPLCQK